MVPVFFGLMGFAFDLGRLYLIKGELNQAASAMALSAATQLIGTSGALDNANSAANQVLDDTTGHGDKYNFGSIVIGSSTGLLASTVNAPSYFANMADATNASGTGTAGPADGTTARHVQITLQADAPLLFWSLLTLGQSRSTPIGAVAVAGISSPVCVACGIEPFAIAALDPTDTIDFGFGPAGTAYTFAYQCTANPPTNPPPAALAGTIVSYLLLDHYDPNAIPDETQQLYRIGAAGLLPNPTSNQTTTGLPMACVTIGSQESVWGTNSGGTSAQPRVCGLGVPSDALNMLCGLYARLDISQAPPDACSAVTDVSTLAGAYQADTDTADPGGDYTAYAGNARRVITVPVVDSLADPTTMNVLGFRQFLVNPDPGGTTTTPSDNFGRFAVLYIGMSPADSNTTPVPVKQGSIAGCQNGAQAGQGPGKVVLHQ